MTRLLDVRLKNTSHLAGFAKAGDLPFFLERVAGIAYQHEPLLAPSEDLLAEYRKRELAWEAYEDRFLALLADRQVQDQMAPDDFQERHRAALQRADRRVLPSPAGLRVPVRILGPTTSRAPLMKIVLNHLTRMRGPRICVAGLDPTGRHVRPVTSTTHKLTRTMLSERGGPFEIGVILDLGEVSATPSAPATEDHEFSVTNTRRLKRLAGEEYFQVLERVAHEDLESIFGPDLKRRKQTFAVDRGQGTTSLGVLRPKQKVELVHNRFGKLRLRLNDNSGRDRPAGDRHPLRRGRPPDDQAGRGRRRAVASAVRVQVILMVGLTRLFQVTDDEEERHWLQVNGVCLADRPLGPKALALDRCSTDSHLQGYARL